MQKSDMGIPLSGNTDAEPERMVFREAKVIRTSFVQKGELTGCVGVPRVRRNQIERGLQLWPNPVWWLTSIKGCLRRGGFVSSDKSGQGLLLIHEFAWIRQNLNHQAFNRSTAILAHPIANFNAFAERSASECARGPIASGLPWIECG